MSEPLDVSTLDWVINDEPLDAEDQMVIDGIVNGYIAEVGLADTVGIALTGPRGSYMKMYGTYKKALIITSESVLSQRVSWQLLF